MPDLQHFSIPFGGGANTREHPLAIQDNECMKLDGWDYNRVNALTNRSCRNTLITLNTTSPGPASYLKEVLVGAVAAPVRYLLMHCPITGQVLVSSDLSTTSLLLTWTTAQLTTQVEVFNGSAWLVNGTDTPQQWTGATATTVVSSVSAMPVARLIRMYKNYCFVARTAANPSRVFFSSLKDPTLWPTNNFQDVSPNDGDEVTALHATPEGLMVFKNRSVWMLIGDTFDATNPQWRLIRLPSSDGIGTVAPESVQTFPGVGVVFAAWDGWYAWNGAAVVRLSAKIEETMEGLVLTQTGYSGTSKTRREGCAAVFRDRYWASVEETTGVNNRTVLRMDAEGRWMVSATQTPYAMTTYNNRLIFARRTGTIEEQEIVSGAGAVTSYVSADAYTKIFDFGDVGRLKHFRRVRVKWSADLNAVVPLITLTPIVDTVSGTAISLVATGANSTQITETNAESGYRTGAELNMSGWTLQFRIQSSALVSVPTTARVLVNIQEIMVEYTMEGVSGDIK